MAWKAASDNALKKAKVAHSTRQVMATVFWDAKGGVVLMIMS